jgi:hypothetical protein
MLSGSATIHQIASRGVLIWDLRDAEDFDVDQFTVEELAPGETTWPSRQ